MTMVSGSLSSVFLHPRSLSSPSSSFPPLYHHTCSSISLHRTRTLSSSFSLNANSSSSFLSSSSLKPLSSSSFLSSPSLKALPSPSFSLSEAATGFSKQIHPSHAQAFEFISLFILGISSWYHYLHFGAGSPDESISYPFLDPFKYFLSSNFLATIIRCLAPSIFLPSVEASSTAIAIFFFAWFAIRLKRFLLFKINAPKDRLLVTDTMVSIACLASALASIVNVLGTRDQIFLTLGGLGLGGAATAFASKDILGNILSGLSLLFANPFSVGDTIHVGSTEGEVVKLGLTATSLLDPLTMSVISVPNSEIANKLLVNRSRSPCRGLSFRIPLDLNTVANLPLISQEIIDALKGNKKIFLENGLPFCHLFQGTKCFSELRIGCYITHMSREEFYSTQHQMFQDITEILKKHRVSLPKTLDSC